MTAKKTTKHELPPPPFTIGHYQPTCMYTMTDWDWAFQFAIRRSCWTTIQSLRPKTDRAQSTSSEQETRATVIRLSRIDRAVDMLLANPIASWKSLEQYDLDESHFWHLSYLLDNTFSSSPAISIPTLRELETFARRARYIATTEPKRLSKPGRTVDADYVQTDAFLDGNPLIICIKAGNSPAILRREFELFLEDQAQRRKKGQNPNKLDTSKFADSYVLAYIDLRIITAYQQIPFYGPGNLAWIFGKKNLSDNTVSKIARLADQLLDEDSPQSQELLALAAIQSNAKRLLKKRTKRGRRPKTE